MAADIPHGAARGRAPLRHRVIVVGAGVGGLSAAALLARQGLQVTVVEAAPEVGGKLRRLAVDGASIDSGPTVFTLRWIFDGLFEALGTRLEDELEVGPLEVLARHHWRGRSDDGEDATHLDLHADAARSREAIGAFAGASAARAFDGFCAEARRIHRTLEGPYIRSQRPGFWRMVADLGPVGLARLAALGPAATLARRLAHHFDDPRLRQLFGRYATYTGSSPWAAPATLMLIAQVELEGVWRVRGGMQAVASALRRCAERQGVAFRLGQRVAALRVEHGRTAGVVLGSGEELAADAVVFNGDVQALASGHLGVHGRRAAAPLPQASRSLSAVTWSMHTATEGVPLAMHNLFFDPAAGRDEFDDLFVRRRLPRRGTVYLCAQDRDGLGRRLAAPPHTDPRREPLLALVNAPALGDEAADRPGHPLHLSEIDACETRSLSLMRACGLRIQPLPHESRRTTPIDFERMFPATGGALYGQASHGWMAQFRRPGASSPLPGLWTVGGSVHPGPGVPMAAMSGRLLAEALVASLGSTQRWHPVATSGGTSTPSATTAATPSR